MWKIDTVEFCVWDAFSKNDSVTMFGLTKSIPHFLAQNPIIYGTKCNIIINVEVLLQYGPSKS